MEPAHSKGQPAYPFFTLTAQWLPSTRKQRSRSEVSFPRHATAAEHSHPHPLCSQPSSRANFAPCTQDQRTVRSEALEALEAGITQLRSSSRRRSSSSRRPSLSPWPAAPRIDLSALDVNSITSSPKVSRLRPRSHSVSTNRPHSPDSRAHGPSRAPLTFTRASACFRSTGTISGVL